MWGVGGGATRERVGSRRGTTRSAFRVKELTQWAGQGSSERHAQLANTLLQAHVVRLLHLLRDLHRAAASTRRRLWHPVRLVRVRECVPRVQQVHAASAMCRRLERRWRLPRRRLLRPGGQPSGGRSAAPAATPARASVHALCARSADGAPSECGHPEPCAATQPSPPTLVAAAARAAPSRRLRDYHLTWQPWQLGAARRDRPRRSRGVRSYDRCAAGSTRLRRPPGPARGQHGAQRGALYSASLLRSGAERERGAAAPGRRPGAGRGDAAGAHSRPTSPDLS